MSISLSPIGKPDIQGRPEIEALVNRFYTKVRQDALLGPVFDDVAKVDWEEHLPRLYAFWESVVFGTGGFRGNPMAVHFKLAQETQMNWQRFQRWLALFLETVDELYEGERADHIKRAADQMAHVIYARINKVPDPRIDPGSLSPEERSAYAQYRASQGE
ncbi:MAG: group III truncated hemoglobin [Candidatus Methylacidiphilales bacterium]